MTIALHRLRAAVLVWRHALGEGEEERHALGEGEEERKSPVFIRPDTCHVPYARHLPSKG